MRWPCRGGVTGKQMGSLEFGHFPRALSHRGTRWYLVRIGPVGADGEAQAHRTAGGRAAEIAQTCGSVSRCGPPLSARRNGLIAPKSELAASVVSNLFRRPLGVHRNYLNVPTHR